MRNGWKSSWLCPDITIGTIPLKKKASTRTLPFIFRGSIESSELTTILRSGRNATAWTAKRLRRALLNRRSNPLFHEEKEHPKNLMRLRERQGGRARPLPLPLPVQDSS